MTKKKNRELAKAINNLAAAISALKVTPKKSEIGEVHIRVESMPTSDQLAALIDRYRGDGGARWLGGGGGYRTGGGSGSAGSSAIVRPINSGSGGAGAAAEIPA